MQEHEFDNINVKIHELSVHQPNLHNKNNHELMTMNVMLKPAAVRIQHRYVRPYRPSSTTMIDCNETTTDR